MKSVIGNGTIATGVLVVSFFSFVGVPNTLPGATFENEKTVELTQTDLFSLPGWQNKSVAVEGVTLGMTKSQVARVAKAGGLKLLTPTVSRGPCRQEEDFCNVYKADGPWIGVDVSFDHDRLVKISVMFPDDGVPAVQKANVTHQFKGLTYKAFKHYSDGLRNQIFGPAEGKERPYDRSMPDSALRYVEYDYPRAGVVVLITIDKRDNPPQPFDIEVDFVARGKD